ncbi:MAG: crossover junction endodeoxyribonuclease RuvC [Holosporaceae bacterium]
MAFILGIDPGLCYTGWALLPLKDTPQKTTWGCIATNAQQPLEKRLVSLFHQLQKIFEEKTPHLVAIEKTLVGRGKPDSLALASARSMSLLLTGLFNLPLFEYAPTHIKKIMTGNGHATKQQVVFMVQQALNTEKKLNSHEADAVAVALTQLYTNQNF